MADYMRVIIEGQLRCLSELHLGSGEANAPEGEDNSVNEIVLDCGGRPIIPAASLRGYLAQQLRDDASFKALFGDTADSTKMGKMGALRAYDARLSDTRWQPLKRTRVAIDPITRAARDKHLINEWLIPRGTVFQVRLELDDIGENALKALLDALSSLNPNNPLARLGQGKSHGRGRIRWEPVSVQTLDQAAFADWLGGDDPLDQAGWQPFGYESRYSHSVQSWELAFHFDEPLLINDPAIVRPNQDDDDREPDMRFTRIDDHRLLIPGASIKGLFRARARRILRTMGADEKRADSLLGELFGSTDGMGALLWYDAVAEITEADIHEQTLIAIDRFTGGVQDGAMLNLEAARPEKAEGVLAFRKALEPWQQALMLLVLRDAMEGDLALGWGQARGFGGFRLEVINGAEHWTRHAGYMDACAQGDETFWQNAFDALDEKIRAEDKDHQEDAA